MAAGSHSREGGLEGAGRGGPGCSGALQAGFCRLSKSLAVGQGGEAVLRGVWGGGGRVRGSAGCDSSGTGHRQSQGLLRASPRLHLPWAAWSLGLSGGNEGHLHLNGGPRPWENLTLPEASQSFEAELGWERRGGQRGTPTLGERQLWVQDRRLHTRAAPASQRGLQDPLPAPPQTVCGCIRYSMRGEAAAATWGPEDQGLNPRPLTRARGAGPGWN